MSNQVDDIIKHVKIMSDSETKKTLALIFTKIYSIGFGGYTREKCIHELEQIYMEKIVGPEIFDK